MTEIIVIKETWADSIIADAFSVAALVALVGIGVWLESDVLQWAGLLALCLGAIGYRQSVMRRMTIAQARAKLDELEGKRP